MREDRTKQNADLSRLVGFIPLLENPGTKFFCQYPTTGSGTDGDPFVLGGSSETAAGSDFITAMYDAGLVMQGFNWLDWCIGDGRRYFDCHDALSGITAEQIPMMMTVLIRADRFNDGFLARAFDDGIILKLARRARDLICNRDGERSSRG
jgi:hypothetical protein